MDDLSRNRLSAFLRYHMHSLTLHLSPFLLCSGCSIPANTGLHPARFSSFFLKRSSCIHLHNLPVSNKMIHNLLLAILSSVTIPSIRIPIMLLFHLPCMPKTISTDNKNLFSWSQTCRFHLAYLHLMRYYLSHNCRKSSWESTAHRRQCKELAYL